MKSTKKIVKTEEVIKNANLGFLISLIKNEQKIQNPENIQICLKKDFNVNAELSEINAYLVFTEDFELESRKQEHLLISNYYH